MTSGRRAARTGRAGAVVGVALACGLGFSAATAVHAASVARTSGSGAISSGSVAISDNDAGVAALGISGGALGASDTSCIRVRTNGTLPSRMRHYAATSGTLAPYLDLQVTKGSSTTGFDDCTGFTPDATDYRGLGAGVVYRGSLTGLGTTWDTGTTDPAGAAGAGGTETWTSGEQHVYRLTVTIRNDPAAAGRSGTATFTWEARNI